MMYSSDLKIKVNLQPIGSHKHCEIMVYGIA